MERDKVCLVVLLDLFHHSGFLNVRWIKVMKLLTVIKWRLFSCDYSSFCWCCWVCVSYILWNYKIQPKLYNNILDILTSEFYTYLLLAFHQLVSYILYIWTLRQVPSFMFIFVIKYVCLCRWEEINENLWMP